MSWNSVLAMLLAFSSVIFFSLMALCVKFTTGQLSTYQLVLGRSLIMTLIFLPGILKCRPILGRRRGLLFLRGFLGFLALGCTFYSVHHMALVDSTLIFQAVPLFVLPFSFLILKEKSTPLQWGYFLLGLAGIAVVLQPGNSELDWVAALVALIGAIITGGTYTLIRKLAATENNQMIIFYFAAIATICSIPPAVLDWQPLDWRLVLLLLAIGFTAAIAQICMTRAYRLEKAANVAIINYFSVPLAALWGWLFWGESPNIYTIIGTMMVLVAVLLMQFGPQKLQRKM